MPGEHGRSCAQELHGKLREAGNSAAELVLITMAARERPNNNNPCRSGYHMYYGAGADVARPSDKLAASTLALTEPAPTVPGSSQASRATMPRPPCLIPCTT
jgi:hypothetical protein